MILILGSARVSRAGCGILPQRTFVPVLSKDFSYRSKSSRWPGDHRPPAESVRSPEMS